MFLNKKVVVVTPAGRRQYLKLLSKYILPNSIVDEWHLWLNTKDPYDKHYIQSLNNPKIRVIQKPGTNGHWNSIHKFFVDCIEDNTVYIRIDDDVVWMEYYALQKLVEFRIKNPEYFLVYGNIVNNSVCDHIHQKYQEAITINEFLGFGWSDHYGVICPNVAIKKHMNLLQRIHDNTYDKYYFPNHWTMPFDARFSINVISWLGEEFAAFQGKVGPDEEQWLSVTKPTQLNKINIICGTTLFSHYAFNIQQYRLSQTNILQLYDNLSNGIIDLPYFDWEQLSCDCDFKELNKIFPKQY